MDNWPSEFDCFVCFHFSGRGIPRVFPIKIGLQKSAFWHFYPKSVLDKWLLACFNALAMKDEAMPPCSKCGKRDGVKRNGIQCAPQSLGNRQRFYCKRCKVGWATEPDPEYKRLGPVHALRDKDQKAIAMYMIGMRFEDIHQFAEVKQSTVRGKLMDVFNQNLWSEMEEKLMARFPFIQRKQFEQLFLLCSDAVADSGAFGRAGYQRTKFWNELTEEEQEALIDKAARSRRAKTSSTLCNHFFVTQCWWERPCLAAHGRQFF